MLAISLPAAAALASALVLAPLPGQADPSTAIGRLDDPERRERAIAELVQSGDACVPLLVPLLQKSGDADEPPAGTLCAALEVLARLGAAARTALPAMQSAYRFASDVAVRNHAAWSIGEVAPAAGDPKVCQEQWRMLRQDRTATLDQNTLVYAFWRLSLGPSPSLDRLFAALDDGGPVAIWAAARSASLLPELPQELLEALQLRLDRALTRTELPWLRDHSCDLATGDLAVTLLQHGVPMPHVARGLLFARDPLLRRQALQSLADEPHLPAHERLDLVRQLWDPDRETRELTAGTLLRLGSRGLVGLRALRAFEAFHQSAERPRLATYYRRCAERLVDAASRDSDEVAAMVRGADAALRGVVSPEVPAAVDDSARAALTAIVVGCRGADDEAPVRLAAFARSCGVLPFRTNDPLRQAFLGLLDSSSFAKWQAGVHALTVLGPAVAPAAPDELGALLLESTVGSPIQETPALFPAEAHIRAGAGADAAQLRQTLGSHRWHVALHAAVELLVRGELVADDAAALRTLLGNDIGEMRTWTSAEFAALTGGHPFGSTYPVPGSAVRAIAALCLTALGERPWEDASLAEDLRNRCDIDPDEDLAEVLSRAGTDGTLHRLAQQVERNTWEELSWPAAP